MRISRNWRQDRGTPTASLGWWLGVTYPAEIEQVRALASTHAAEELEAHYPRP